MISKNKGFTLIELLAVILILGIIALIAIPTVNKIVDEAKRGAFESSANNILKAGEQKYFTESLKSTTAKNVYKLEDNELDYKGDTAIKGFVGVKDDIGAIAVNNGKYCAKKNLNDDKIEISEYNGFCEIDPELIVKDVDPTCFTFDEATGTITGYDSSCGDSIRIPSQINGVTVTTIGDKAFYKDKVTLCYDNPTYTYTYPNNSKEKMETDDLACYDNQDGGLLRYVEIPNTVTYIGDEAFHANRLEKLYLPDSITSMGEWVFAENQITELKLPNNIQSMETCVFERNFIEELNIPGSLKVIPTYAFGCNKLTKVTLNEGIEEVKSSAFWNHFINEITIPKSIKKLNRRSFNWGETKKVIIKGKDSSADFELFDNPDNDNIFGWADGYDDSYIVYEGK